MHTRKTCAALPYFPVLTQPRVVRNGAVIVFGQNMKPNTIKREECSERQGFENVRLKSFLQLLQHNLLDASALKLDASALKDHILLRMESPRSGGQFLVMP